MHALQLPPPTRSLAARSCAWASHPASTRGMLLLSMGLLSLARPVLWLVLPPMAPAAPWEPHP